jgi:SPP1 gp7 family putative phage head morphogenesis protein
VRPELLVSLPDVLAALGCDTEDDEPAELVKAAAGKGDGASQWPGWDADLTAADHWAPLIAAALAGALSASKGQRIAAAYLAQQPQPDGEPDKDALTAAATAWLTAQGLDLVAPLAKALPGLYTDGYLIGLTSAQAVLAGQQADRGGWQPGNTASAEQVIGQAQADGGLADTVALAPTTAQGVAQSRMRDLARGLVTGLIAGATSKEVGVALTSVLTDTGKALTVAVTEITRASGQAAQVAYQQQGVASIRWLSEEDDNVCPACLAQEAAGPRPINSSPMPPLHPRCRCAPIPA